MCYRLIYGHHEHTLRLEKTNLIVCILYLVRVERIYEDIQVSIGKKSIQDDFQLSKLPLVISRVTALMGILVCTSWILNFPLFLIIGCVLSLLMILVIMFFLV